MVPLRILTLVFTGQVNPSVLVLEPIEQSYDSKSRVVPIWIGANEAVQVGVAIEHIKMPRPMTHDLFINTLNTLDARVDHVLINDVKDQTFFAKLYVKQGAKLIEMDARPTDAISLALREDAPFMIDEKVLERASYPYIFKSKEDKEIELANFHEFLEGLSPEDFNLS
jgi:bifunctional DNase/RNase